MNSIVEYCVDCDRPTRHYCRKCGLPLCPICGSEDGICGACLEIMDDDNDKDERMNYENTNSM